MNDAVWLIYRWRLCYTYVITTCVFFELVFLIDNMHFFVCHYIRASNALILSFSDTMYEWILNKECASALPRGEHQCFRVTYVHKACPSRLTPSSSHEILKLGLIMWGDGSSTPVGAIKAILPNLMCQMSHEAIATSTEGASWYDFVHPSLETVGMCSFVHFSGNLCESSVETWSWNTTCEL